LYPVTADDKHQLWSSPLRSYLPSPCYFIFLTLAGRCFYL